MILPVDAIDPIAEFGIRYIKIYLLSIRFEIAQRLDLYIELESIFRLGHLKVSLLRNDFPILDNLFLLILTLDVQSQSEKTFLRITMIINYLFLNVDNFDAC